jgi:hypothetical protein
MLFSRLYLLALLFPTCIYASAQNNSFGAGISVTDDLYKIDDPHGAIRRVPLIGSEEAIYWRHNFKTDFFSQLGVSTKPYWEGFKYNNAFAYLTSPSFTAIKLNADVGHRFRLTNNLWLVPQAGISIVGNTATYIGSAIGIETTSADGAIIHSVWKERDDVNRFFALVHGSIGFEYDLFTSFIIGIHAGYHAGFMKANVLAAQYSFDNSPNYNATLTSRGQYRDAGIGIAYRITRRASN